VTHLTIGNGKTPVVELKIPNDGDDHLPGGGVRRRSGGYGTRSASAQAGMTSIHNLRLQTCKRHHMPISMAMEGDDFDGL
jgi:hypothetical protein